VHAFASQVVKGLTLDSILLGSDTVIELSFENLSDLDACRRSRCSSTSAMPCSAELGSARLLVHEPQ
jgi:hypothetical protein